MQIHFSCASHVVTRHRTRPRPPRGLDGGDRYQPSQLRLILRFTPIHGRGQLQIDSRTPSRRPARARDAALAEPRGMLIPGSGHRLELPTAVGRYERQYKSYLLVAVKAGTRLRRPAPAASSPTPRPRTLTRRDVGRALKLDLHISISKSHLPTAASWSRSHQIIEN